MAEFKETFPNRIRSITTIYWCNFLKIYSHRLSNSHPPTSTHIAVQQQQQKVLIQCNLTRLCTRKHRIIQCIFNRQCIRYNHTFPHVVDARSFIEGKLHQRYKIITILFNVNKTNERVNAKAKIQRSSQIENDLFDHFNRYLHFINVIIVCITMDRHCLRASIVFIQYFGGEWNHWEVCVCVLWCLVPGKRMQSANDSNMLLPLMVCRIVISWNAFHRFTNIRLMHVSSSHLSVCAYEIHAVNLITSFHVSLTWCAVFSI